MRFDILTIFPDFFSALELSLIGKAQTQGLLEVNVNDLRSWTHDTHRTVDDAPFGGGAGMVMKADVWAEAIDAVLMQNSQSGRQVLAIPTPAGKPLTQEICANLAQAQQVLVACGRYEGIDARIAQYYAEQTEIEVLEYSLGDYVLNGGEVAAIALVEAVGRLVPGMVGNPDSLIEESHGEAGLLEYPVYTRPVDFRGYKVPEVLLSGNHLKIADWRYSQAVSRTLERRPDMLQNLDASRLNTTDLAHFASFGWYRKANASTLTNVVFRSATAEDLPVLLDLAERYESTYKDPELSLDFYTYDESSLRGQTWIAQTATKEIIAYGIVSQTRSQLRIAQIFVTTSWQDSGLYFNFLEYIFSQLQMRYANQKNMQILLRVKMRDTRMQKFYKKLGFRRFTVTKRSVGDEFNEYLTLVRPLNMEK